MTWQLTSTTGYLFGWPDQILRTYSLTYDHQIKEAPARYKGITFLRLPPLHLTIISFKIMFTAENHNSQAEKRRRTDSSSLGQSPNTTDNHLESQPEKRRRADQPPPPKSVNKHEATNTPAKTSSIVAKGPTQSSPLASITPSITQTSKSTPDLRQATTEPPLENVVNTNMKAGDPSSLKQPQTSPTSSSVHRWEFGSLGVVVYKLI